MTASANRARSKPVLRIGLPLLALASIAVALLVPSLGSARSQSAGEPTISGGTSVGDTLTGNPGTWAPNAASYKYNWRRCPPDGGEGAGTAKESSTARRTRTPSRPGTSASPSERRGEGVRQRRRQDRSGNLECDVPDHRTRRRADQHRAADDHGHRGRRTDADRERGVVGEQVPRELRGQLAPLRHNPEQLPHVRRDGNDPCRRRRRHGVHPALPGHGDEPGRHDGRDLRAVRGRPRLARRRCRRRLRLPRRPRPAARPPAEPCRWPPSARRCVS